MAQTFTNLNSNSLMDREMDRNEFLCEVFGDTRQNAKILLYAKMTAYFNCSNTLQEYLFIHVILHI